MPVRFALSEKELSNVAHREYTQAYAFGENRETVNCDDSQSRGDYVYIADVKGAQDGYAYLEMRNRFKKGDLLEVLSPDANFAKTFVADEIYTSKGEETEDCKLVQEIYKVKCPFALKTGDYIRRKVSK